MDSTELRDAFRDETGDVASPPLWSDAAIFRYMTEAQRMFCRLTEGLEDARTPSVVNLTVKAGAEWVNTSPLILKLREAYDTRGVPLRVLSVEKAAEFGLRFDGSTGVVRALVSGFERHALRVHPTPTVDTQIKLSVFRMPLAVIDSAGAVLEIEEQHHNALLLWMKHLAYAKQDAETYDRARSDDFEVRFRNYCFEAEKEQNRARHPAGAVVYGGL